MKRNTVIAIIYLLGNAGIAHATVTCGELQSSYSRMLQAYNNTTPKPACGTGYVAQYNTTFSAYGTALCNCLESGQNQSACTALSQLCCEIQTQSGKVGNVIITQRGTWNSNSKTCSAVNTSYHCAAGYYGTPTGTAASGCTQCPEAAKTYQDATMSTKARGTSAEGSTTQDQCYLAKGPSYHDVSGIFTLNDSSSNCYY